MKYPVKIRLRSFMTMTALFIMILPRKTGAGKAGGIPMRHYPDAGIKHFFMSADSWILRSVCEWADRYALQIRKERTEK